jgi:uncharacterized protein
MIMKDKIRILSIDGGGIRGIIPAMVLDILEKKLQAKKNNPNVRLADYFDFVAGTSTGGIITCALLAPNLAKGEDTPSSRYSANDILNLYLDNGATIFKGSFANRLLKDIPLLDEKYQSDGIEGVLAHYFEDLKLSQLLKPCLVTSYNTERREAHFFTQQKAISEGDGRDFWLKDVCRATSAAPTYFEPAYIKSLANIHFSLVDGGIFANNPTMCALAEVRKMNSVSPKSPLKAPKIEDVFLVSLGTGSVKTPYMYDKIKDKPSLLMIPAIIDMMMSGVSETTDYQIRKMFEGRLVKDQYTRIEVPSLTNEEAEMDNASDKNLESLKAIGFQTASRYDLDAIANTLIEIEESRE